VIADVVRLIAADEVEAAKVPPQDDVELVLSNAYASAGVNA
jgi:hypothetical protein